MKLFPVVRIDCGDPMDRSEWIPLSKVEKIKINLDGTDYILANGVWETCYEGYFNISDYFDEELMEAEQTEPATEDCSTVTDCSWK